jgi:predicted metal-dependent hydrolase
MPEITVNDIIIDVVRKSIKNLYLTIYPPDKVRISAPIYANDNSIKRFILSKLSWIKKHKIKFEKQQTQFNYEYISGESHHFQGHSYLLNVIYSKKNIVMLRDKQYIDLYVTEGSSYNKRNRVMNQWHRQQLHEQIIIYINKWQQITGLEINGYGIKKMKTKWGSCNIKTRYIWLNLELIKKPLHCLEYVIVHELVHLLERKHNARFKSYMDKLMPEWRNYRKELNNFLLEHQV